MIMNAENIKMCNLIALKLSVTRYLNKILVTQASYIYSNIKMCNEPIKMNVM